MTLSDNTKFFISVFVPFLGVVIGWIAVNYLTAKRERLNKLRDTKIQYNIEAYGYLNDALGLQDAKSFEYLNNAFSKIQLFGGEDQIRMTHRIMDDLRNNREVDFGPLSNSLRNQLRNELNVQQSNLPLMRISLDSARNYSIDIDEIYGVCPNNDALIPTGYVGVNQSTLEPLRVRVCPHCKQEHVFLAHELVKFSDYLKQKASGAK